MCIDLFLSFFIEKEGAKNIRNRQILFKTLQKMRRQFIRLGNMSFHKAKDPPRGLGRELGAVSGAKGGAV